MHRQHSKAILKRHLVNNYFYYSLWNVINLLRFESEGTSKLVAVMVLLSSRGGVCLFL